MIRLTTFSRGHQADAVHRDVAEALKAWLAERKLLALLSDASEPVGGRKGPVPLLVTPVAWAAHRDAIVAAAGPLTPVLVFDPGDLGSGARVVHPEDPGPPEPARPAPTLPRTLPRTILARPASTLEPEGDDVPVIDTFTRTIGLLPPRSRAILRGRLGLDGAPVTLKELSARYGIPPERILRIQEDALGKVERRTSVLTRVDRLLGRWTDHLPCDVAPILSEPWARNMPEVTLAFLAERRGGIHAVTVIPGRSMLCPFPQDAWDSARLRLSGIVARARLDEGLDDIMAAFRATASGETEAQGMRVLAGILLGGFRHAAGAKARLGLWDDIAGRILSPGVPLRARDVRRRLRGLGLGRELAGRRLEATLAGVATDIGKGRFVRVEPSPDPEGVAAACVAVMRTGDHRAPWRTHDLLDRLRRREPMIGSRLDVPVLERTLLMAATVKRVRPGKWRLAGNGNWPLRFEDAAIAELERNGGPLAAAELVRRVQASHEHIVHPQPRPGQRLCVVDRGMWGLVERDIPVSPEHGRMIVGLMVERCDPDRATLSEMFDLLGTSCGTPGVANPHILGTLLHLAGYRLGKRGGFRRDMPRPGSLMSRIVEILEQAPEGLTGDEIWKRTKEAAGRRPSPYMLVAALVRYGHRIDETRWTARPHATQGRAEPAAAGPPGGDLAPGAIQPSHPHDP